MKEVDELSARLKEVDRTDEFYVEIDLEVYNEEEEDWR